MSEVRVYDAPSDLVGRWVRQADIQALRAENARLKGALETIVNTDRGLESSNREQHKRYIADDNWWGEKRHSHTFEAWIAQAALQPERGKP